MNVASYGVRPAYLKSWVVVLEGMFDIELSNGQRREISTLIENEVIDAKDREDMIHREFDLPERVDVVTDGEVRRESAALRSEAHRVCRELQAESFRALLDRIAEVVEVRGADGILMEYFLDPTANR